MTNSPESENDPPTPPEDPRHKRKGALFWTTLLLVILAIGWLLYWFFYLQYHETTDNAYVNGNMINVTSVISGSPTAFFADDTDLVKEGQLLVMLDCTDYQIRFDLELKILASTVLNVRQLYDNVKQSAANVENKRILLERAHYDYENRSKLVGNLAISNEDYIHSKDDFTLAEINYRQAQYQLEIAISAAGNTPLEKHPQIEAQKDRVREAYYYVRHCSIFAPATGFVAQRQVQVGQWVTPNSPLMVIIPINYMWVDANFKETQLTYMRIGQPATITFDLYGRHPVFEGKVLGIASGTGSVFSLIPPQNATGNWIKIVQRLPVRIGFDLEKYKNYPLRIGLSSYVNVNITNTDLPPLATIPANKPVGITTIFDIDYKEVDQLIEKTIHENLAIPKE